MVTPGSRTRLFDRYELLEPLGRGGMGVVWLADDTVLQRKVAMKEVNVPADLDPDEAEAMRARVMREARAAGRLNHPNVTTIYDVVRDDSRTLIVMEYVDAPTLTEVVTREGPLPAASAARIGLALLSALEAAHAQGIVHRDLKPGNVMVPAAGNVKLADFGVAAVQGDPKITMTGLIVGSPSFMSPEQAQERHATAATDLWGLGATLYYAVEGVPPFDRGAAIPTLTAVAREPPRMVSRGTALEPLLLRLLQKDPADRPTLGEVRAELVTAVDAGTPTVDAGVATVAGTPTLVEGDHPETDDGDEPWVDEDEHWVTETARRRRGAWPVLLVAAALLVVAWFVLPRFLGGGETPNDRQDTTEQNDRDKQRDTTELEDRDSQPEESAADEEQPRQGGEVEVPADWVGHDVADTGSTVAYPAEWSVQQRDDTTADIRDPQGGRYLRVQYTDSPKDDAVADWEQQSQSFGTRHDDYTEIAIEPFDYPGADTSALWEYTYSDGGAQLHAYNLAIVIGGRGYALNFQTRENRWEESQDLWQQFVAGFDPAL
ncbi:MAG: protein kinase [Nitriliruptorales bacterium]|nr:protein kinase [Nitriliruptorales bacterium]